MKWIRFKCEKCGEELLVDKISFDNKMNLTLQSYCSGCNQLKQIKVDFEKLIWFASQSDDGGNGREVEF